ncbi:hypothetical protein EBB07_16945 [Paenibacillaceae bacterium]|nr:hypothetical protein EBB07_16945 [Paenibacillaceae bacterium]
MKKTLLSLVVLGMTVTGAAGVYAGTKLEKINAYLNHDIGFKVNGSAYTPKDGNGSKLAPITYNNLTYLPVRAISETLGVKVTYDAAHNQVLLDAKQEAGPGTSDQWTKVVYTEAQLKVIKQAYSEFESFETAYAPGQMAAGDSYVKAAASSDGVNLLFKHMTVNVSPRDYSSDYESKSVKLSNGVTAKWYTPDETPMLGFQLDDRTVTISSPDGSLSSAQIEKIAVSVAKLQ